MARVPQVFSRRTALGKLVAKLNADVVALAAIPAHRREAELADVRESDARVLLEEAKSRKLVDER
jgi:hypothetical protein